jgi:hypothetical protein
MTNKLEKIAKILSNKNPCHNFKFLIKEGQAHYCTAPVETKCIYLDKDSREENYCKYRSKQ